MKAKNNSYSWKTIKSSVSRMWSKWKNFQFQMFLEAASTCSFFLLSVSLTQLWRKYTWFPFKSLIDHGSHNWQWKIGETTYRPNYFFPCFVRGWLGRGVKTKFILQLSLTFVWFPESITWLWLQCSKLIQEVMSINLNVHKIFSILNTIMWLKFYTHI